MRIHSTVTLNTAQLYWNTAQSDEIHQYYHGVMAQSGYSCVRVTLPRVEHR